MSDYAAQDKQRWTIVITTYLEALLAIDILTLDELHHVLAQGKRVHCLLQRR